MDFPEGVFVEVTGLRYGHEEKFHIGDLPCNGVGCGICARYKAMWAEIDGRAVLRTEHAMSEARALKPIPRFHYDSNQGSFPVGKFLHEEFTEKGPNVKVKKTMISSSPFGDEKERKFAKYEVVKI